MMNPDTKLIKTRDEALRLMKLHGLRAIDGWSFHYDNAKRRLGLCDHSRKRIQLSRCYVELNFEDNFEMIRDTILHEIAHAIVGARHGHDHVWRAKAREIGCLGTRTKSAEMIKAVDGRFRYTCPNCDASFTMHKRSRRGRACGECCRKYAGNRYDERFKMQLTVTR